MRTVAKSLCVSWPSVNARAGQILCVPTQKLPTFDECFNMYYKSIETKSDSLNTKRRYELHVKPTFGHVKIDDITTQMVEDFKIKSKKLKS